MIEIRRDIYLNRLIKRIGNGRAKVITGIRRCGKSYLQSALSIPDKEKEIQESRSLTNINDSFKKIIIVKDHIMPRRNEDGILTIGLFDFLLKEDSLDL